jgi:hypothetical protein
LLNKRCHPLLPIWNRCEIPDFWTHLRKKNWALLVNFHCCIGRHKEKHVFYLDLQNSLADQNSFLDEKTRLLLFYFLYYSYHKFCLLNLAWITRGIESSSVQPVKKVFKKYYYVCIYTEQF